MDNPEDYEFLRVVFQALYPKNPVFSMEDILQYLTLHPELENLNGHIPVDAGVQRSLMYDYIVPTAGMQAF